MNEPNEDDPRLYREVSPEIESFFDALEAANFGSGEKYGHGFFDRPCGLVEGNGVEIVFALLMAGWRPPANA